MASLARIRTMHILLFGSREQGFELFLALLEFLFHTIVYGLKVVVGFSCFSVYDFVSEKWT